MTQVKIKKNIVSESLFLISPVKYPEIVASVHYFDGTWFVECKGWEKFELETKKEAIDRAKKMILSNVDDLNILNGKKCISN